MHTIVVEVNHDCSIRVSWSHGFIYCYVKTHLQNGLKKHFCIIKAQSCPRVEAVKFMCQQNSRMFLSIYKVNFSRSSKKMF